MLSYEVISKQYGILDTVKRLGLEGQLEHLKEYANGVFRCKSVFNPGKSNEVTSIDTVKNSWYDFKEQQGGGVIQLVALLKYGSICSENIKRAAHDIAGTEYDEKYFVRYEKARIDFEKKTNEAHKKLFNDDEVSKKTLDYLFARGLTEETIKKFKIGITQIKLFDPDENKFVEEFRLFIPIFNEFNNPVYAVFRKLDSLPQELTNWHEGTPKYYKLPLSYTDEAGEKHKKVFLQSLPMGLNTIPVKEEDCKTLLIGEGCFDFLLAAQEGYSALFSAGGSFSAENLEIIKNEAIRFDDIITVYDNDSSDGEYSNSGHKFTYKTGRLLFDEKIPFKCVTSYGKNGDKKDIKDLAEYYELVGDFEDLLQNAVNGYVFLAEQFVYREKNSKNKDFAGRRFWQIKDPEDSMLFFRKLRRFVLDAKDAACLSDDGYKDFKKAICAYFPESKWKELENISKKEHFLECREKFFQSIEFDDLRPNFHWIGSIAHGNYMAYNQAGYWQPVNDSHVHYLIERALNFSEMPKTIEDIEKSFKNRLQKSPNKIRFNSRHVFSFLNGVLDLTTGDFREHRPDDLITFQANFNYDETATCPMYDKFLQDITLGEKSRIDFLDDICGYALVPDNRFEKAAILLGKGRNGKGTFLHILEALFKSSNDDDCTNPISHIEPKDLKDPTKVIMLEHSWLNLAYDIDSDLRGCERLIKQISSRDPITGNLKFKDTKSFVTRAKLIMASNHMPKLHDISNGMKSRLMFCKFCADFSNNPDVGLASKIIKFELPGIFNRIYRAYKNLLIRGFIREACDQDSTLHDFSLSANPILQFWETEFSLKLNPNYECQTFEVFKEYSEWCKTHGYKIPNEKNFQTSFIMTMEGIEGLTFERIQRREGYSRPYFYRFVHKNSEPVQVKKYTAEMLMKMNLRDTPMVELQEIYFNEMEKEEAIKFLQLLSSQPMEIQSRINNSMWIFDLKVIDEKPNGNIFEFDCNQNQIRQTGILKQGKFIAF